MRKEMQLAIAIIALVAGGTVVLVDSGARAADTRVSAGTSSDPLKFLPKDIVVPIGTTVIWTNESSLPHDVSAENGAFDSRGTFDQGKEYRFTFNQAGTFPYFCTPHRDAGMVGTVTVSGGAATPPAVPPPAAPPPAAPPPAGGGTTSTTARAGGPATTTTRPGAGDSAGPTTTTTAGLGVTSTTQAAATTPTSAPESADVTTTTEGHGEQETAAETHGSAGGTGKKTNALVVGVAGILTAVLAAISLKLLASKP